jgi:hypothetical protein
MFGSGKAKQIFIRVGGQVLYMKLKWIILGLLLLVGGASAAIPPQYGTGYMSPFFPDNTVANVTYNTSIQFMTTDTTPVWSYLFLASVAILFFILSLLFSAYKQFNNVDGICAVVSIIGFFVTALRSNYVAATDSYGVMNIPIKGGTGTYDVISMQQINVWQLDMATYLWWFMFIVAILNLIRIIIQHGKSAMEEAQSGREQR